MMRLKLVGVLCAAAVAAACGSSSKSSGGGSTGFPQPAGTVAVNFSVDDTANKVYTAGNLQWKGSMAYDATTRKVTLDSTWTGPFPTLYDDGPWDQGGHEPIGSTAGDHKWGVTVFVTPPATGATNFEYGLNDSTYSNGWIWQGSNGTFSVAAGATAPITAPGQTMPAFGTVDMQLVIDTNNLDTSTTWDTSVVKVKGSATAWTEVVLTNDGTGRYPFALSSVVGAGHTFAHSGLLHAGDKPEFIFVFGPGTGKEYKDASNVALATGVTAGTKPPGGSGYAATAVGLAANNNTNITVPAWTPFAKPPGTVAVNFTVDDTANKVYTVGNLQWKGSMAFDAVTRMIILDSTWTGPFATLYDDGPYTVGGHEPLGSTAGDHKWGVAVFVTPPATGATNFEYGLNDATYSNGWIWSGSNGTFAVAAGATADITAPGQTMPAFGTNDMQLVIDTNNLDTSTTWDTSVVKVKGSATAWTEVVLANDGTGKYPFTLSDVVGAGHTFAHSGLLHSGDKPEFIFVFGPGAGKEYKDASNVALATGVTAAVMPQGGSWTAVAVGLAANNNTNITIP